MKIDDVIAKFDMGAGVFSREEMEVALDAYLSALAENDVWSERVYELEDR